jgi:hypothetical protein
VEAIRNHLNSAAREGDALARWVDKKSGLLVDLLYQMAQSLGYDIDKVTIQNNAYHPKGFVETETEQHALRKAVLAVMSGERPVQTTIVGRVQTTAPLPPPEEVRPKALPQPAMTETEAENRRPDNPQN